ncbi:glutaminyl-tRNA synthase (glutamine-hydrolyzing) subunit B [Candidatus Kuenenbacteria bacterium RIFCSPHIGHO2_02_FULL_39_13]|uniref:Aspartyl/glutamyl-tRNA(Asn/Gln) amidotransferase subunit B n=1 Tax=Candidatus Kuenenbacteria bacterium RIFCSPHIGHO2_02_FULL_39_13 TaxID=1798561 RepID=A0A1F6FP92_9BACT|nr:MAG: glutaminyl-tRNA synthase (glutamine-hydrolyzing) subunit B [Candidatus Kuenenbacteria bacterium RIFCSPHIGHO2_02_FULL_39_13]
MKQTKYKPTIGLEIHVQLKTKSKMFCACPNDSWKIGLEELKPNINICPVCTAQPGSLPVINKNAINMVVKTGLALNCQIAKHSKFDRKNYFYPDLPKGYQISQYDQPISANGYLEINNRKIGITRIHLEEDTGKLVHPAGVDYSLVDLNRAGVPLMEMVTEPDIHSAKDAKEFCQKVQQIFRYLDISDADMEKSQMRCEVNISLSNRQERPDVKSGSRASLGIKVEVKNLNSFKAVERSIEYEFIRQSKLLEQGEPIIQETRGWNEREQKTFSQREKEESHDYRYFPEPDLPLLEFDENYIKKIKAQLPELPDAKQVRFQKQYGFSVSDVKLLISNGAMAAFTENVMSELRAWLVDLDEIELSDDQAWDEYKIKLSKLTANWLINKLQGIMAAKKISFLNLKVTPENFAEFITLIYKNKVNSANAQKILITMVDTGADPTNILEDQGMHLMEDVGDLEPIVDQVIKNNPDQIQAFKTGKTVLLKFFIGAVMKESHGKANPKMAEDLLLQKLT